MAKRNIWSDPSPYGTYQGEAGNPDMWKASFEQAFYSREKSVSILKEMAETPEMILGIPKGASQGEIKNAFRKLAIIHHPDKGGDRVEFEKIMAAYSLLSGDKK